MEERLLEDDGAEDLVPELVAAALAALLVAPTWDEATAARAALGLAPFTSGPEGFAAYLEALRRLALVAAPEGLIQ